MRTLILAVTGFAFAVTACSSGGTSVVEAERVPVAAISVDLPAASLIAGQTELGTATPRGPNGAPLANRIVSWQSSSAAVASVTDAGLITAVAPGAATITATSEGVSGQASMSVLAPPPVPVANVSVSLASGSLNPGQTTQATAIPRDANNNVLTGRAVSWASGNNSIATVSASGVVTAVGVGSTQITASSEGQSGSATLAVATAPPVPVASVSVTLAASLRNPGQTTQATATTRDANNNVLTGRAITWSSSNTGVATVSNSGLVTALAVGAVQIIASCDGKTGSATLTVASPPAPAPVASVSVSLASSGLNPGQSTQATATTRDASNNVLTGRTISWTSDNTAVATVTASGLVSSVAIGTAQITANSEGQSGSATLTVSVAPPPPPPGSSNEPAGMTVITDRPFSALNEMGWSDDTVTPQGGSFGLTNDATAPKSPSSILRILYPAGFTSSGAGPGGAELNLSRPRSLYIVYWARLSSNFYGHDAQVNKQFYVWSGGTPLMYFDASTRGMGPITPRIALQDTKSHGTADLEPNLVPSARLVRGEWYKIEVLLVGNTAGARDGSVDWWLNGVHIGSHTVQWTTGANFWNIFVIDAIWGGSGGYTVPATQWLDFDHLYLSGKP
jgi:uncharacterized protein YjdB